MLELMTYFCVFPKKNFSREFLHIFLMKENLMKEN